MNIFRKFKNKRFVYNTFLIIISGAIVKFLGLLNKIYITRLLGTNGMSLYVLAFPTIILFISLSGFSLNVTTSKLIAEGLSTKRYSPKKIIKSAIKLAITTSIFVSLLFIFSLSFIVNNLLKRSDLYMPLFMTIFLIPLVGITDTFRGVFSGYQKMNTVASVNIIEQIARIIFSIGGIIFFSKYGLILAVSFTIIALTIGEAASLIYLLIKIKKLYIIDYECTENEKKAVWNMAFPTTLSRLIGSFTYFLEPIVNNFILLRLGYSKKLIIYDYTIINAYILPMMTICIFLSTAISTTTVPTISESSSKNSSQNIKLIEKIFFLSIIPGAIISTLLFLYPKEYLNLFFSTTAGYGYIRRYTFIFLFHYLQSPGVAILQALGKSKEVFKICSFYNIFKIVLIILLAFIPQINTYSLFYSIIIVMLLETFTIWIYIYKLTNYKPNKISVINLLLITLFLISIGLLLNIYINSFIFKSIILIIMFLILIYKFKIFDSTTIIAKKVYHL